MYPYQSFYLISKNNPISLIDFNGRGTDPPDPIPVKTKILNKSVTTGTVIDDNIPGEELYKKVSDAVKNVFKSTEENLSFDNLKEASKNRLITFFNNHVETGATKNISESGVYNDCTLCNNDEIQLDYEGRKLNGDAALIGFTVFNKQTEQTLTYSYEQAKAAKLFIEVGGNIGAEKTKDTKKSNVGANVKAGGEISNTQKTTTGLVLKKSTSYEIKGYVYRTQIEYTYKATFKDEGGFDYDSSKKDIKVIGDITVITSKPLE